MIDLVSVTHALSVAEHLSFSRAAQNLGVQQSAVSRRVRALEDKLGVSLFERDSTGVRITEAGRRFLDRTRPALAEIDHAMKAAASAGRGAEGVIRIGTSWDIITVSIRQSLSTLLRAQRTSTWLGLPSGKSTSRSSPACPKRCIAIRCSCGKPASSRPYQGGIRLPTMTQYNGIL